MDREDFINYVLEFYNGKTGIYKDVDATYLEVVSATRRLEREYGNEVWADYYSQRADWEFGVNPKITKTLSKYGLHAEWLNAGELGVYN